MWLFVWQSRSVSRWIADWALPGVEVPCSLREVYVGLEEIAESGSVEQVGLWTIGGDASVLHHEDAVDLRDDIGDVVGDEQDASSLLGEFA